MFLNLILLGGLLAAGIPLAVHVAHRRNIQPVEWGAMRFLVQMARRNRRRLFLDQWLLLAVRMFILLCLALALLRPAIPPEAPAKGLERTGAVSAVILFDDSASTAAGRGETALTRQKELALAYLDTLKNGDEVCVLRLSELAQQRPSPLYDLTAAREQIAAIRSTGVSSDMPALLEAGLVQLTRQRNPAAELVLITDGGAEGWRPEERGRWSEIRRRFRAEGEGALRVPRLLLLQARQANSLGNVAVTGITPDSALIPVGKTVHLQVGLRQTGEVPGDGMRLLLRMDGRTIAQREVVLSPGESRSLSFSCSFTDAGGHLLDAEITGGNDSFPADDRRSYALEAQTHIPVLLVEEAGNAPSSLEYVACALDPQGTKEGLFRLSVCGVGDLAGRDLDAYRVIVFGDIAVLDRQSVLQVERYLAAGGGVLLEGGARMNADFANRFWARGGDGFLPCPLKEVCVPVEPLAPGNVQSSHPALTAFAGEGGEAFKTARVYRYFSLNRKAVAPGDLQTLATLDNGDALVVERQRGQGRSVFVTTSLDLRGSNLPARPLFVPLMRGLASYLASEILPPRNLQPGQPLCYRARASSPAQALMPDGQALPLTEGTWEGVRAYYSAPLRELGGYTITDGGRSTYFAVQPDEAESLLERLPAETSRQTADTLSPFTASDAASVRAAFSGQTRRAVELWRWFLLASVAFLFLESWLCRRQTQREKEAGTAMSGVRHESGR